MTNLKKKIEHTLMKSVVWLYQLNLPSIEGQRDHQYGEYRTKRLVKETWNRFGYNN